MARKARVLNVTSGRWVNKGEALEAFAELSCGHTVTTTWTALYKWGRPKSRIPCPICAEAKRKKKLRITTMKGN